MTCCECARHGDWCRRKRGVADCAKYVSRQVQGATQILKIAAQRYEYIYVQTQGPWSYPHNCCTALPKQFIEYTLHRSIARHKLERESKWPQCSVGILYSSVNILPEIPTLSKYCSCPNKAVCSFK